MEHVALYLLLFYDLSPYLQLNIFIYFVCVLCVSWDANHKQQSMRQLTLTCLYLSVFRSIGKDVHANKLIDCAYNISIKHRMQVCSCERDDFATEYRRWIKIKRKGTAFPLPLMIFLWSISQWSQPN